MLKRAQAEVLLGMGSRGDPPGMWSAHVLVYPEGVTVHGPHRGLVCRMQSDLSSQATLGHMQASVFPGIRTTLSGVCDTSLGPRAVSQ